ncbi:helix-turn-helix domain-containing protein [Streptomyces roseoverticillatus]|nr:helix-turn-helix domain-containing protein [Streptomyces roseoverticillatus]
MHHNDRPALPGPHKRDEDGGTRARAQDEKLTVKEVIVDLKIAPSTFYRWRRLGKAPRSIKLPNGDVRIRRSEYDRWLAEREDAA